MEPEWQEDFYIRSFSENRSVHFSGILQLANANCIYSRCVANGVKRIQYLCGNDIRLFTTFTVFTQSFTSHKNPIAAIISPINSKLYLHLKLVLSFNFILKAGALLLSTQQIYKYVSFTINIQTPSMLNSFCELIFTYLTFLYIYYVNSINPHLKTHLTYV